MESKTLFDEKKVNLFKKKNVFHDSMTKYNNIIVLAAYKNCLQFFPFIIDCEFEAF
jgi:hypothetical protein